MWRDDVGFWQWSLLFVGDSWFCCVCGMCVFELSSVNWMVVVVMGACLCALFLCLCAV